MSFRVVDEDAPPVGGAGEPVFVLRGGVSYVRGWARAEDAAARLRAELAACGLAGRVVGVRAEVTVAGIGVVDLGRVTPATADLLADLLAVARRAAGWPAGGGVDRAA